jgi:hypothetical protein
MNPTGQNVPPIKPDGRGASAEAPQGPSGAGKTARRKQQQRSDPALEIPSSVISGAALRGLIDESIVPALVERFVQEKCSLPTEQPHNGQQP